MPTGTGSTAQSTAPSTSHSTAPLTSPSPTKTMDSPVDGPQKTDPASPSTSSDPTSNSPPPPPTSSSSSSTSSHSSSPTQPPPPPPTSSTSTSSTKSPPPPPPPPKTSSTSSVSSPTPPTSPTPTPPDTSSASSTSPEAVPTVPSSPTSDPASSLSGTGTGSVTNVTSGSVAETMQNSSTSPSPRGARVTAISTVIITTQAGGQVVTLTTTFNSPTLNANNGTGQHSGVNTHAIAAASVIGGLAVLSVAAWGLFAYRRKRRRYHMERDSATAAMAAAGILPPRFVDSPNITPRVERASQHYFEDGTPITSVLEPLNQYGAYGAAGLQASSNGASTPSGNEWIGAKRSPSERSAVIYATPSDEQTSRSHSPPGVAMAYPPAAFNNHRRSMRSTNSSSEESHSQGHTSLVIPQQQPQPFGQMLAPPPVPSINYSLPQPYTYPHTYPATISPAGSSPQGSGNSHDEHEALLVPTFSPRNQSQSLSRTYHDVRSTENSRPKDTEPLMGTPAGIPVSSSEISVGFGDSEGYGSTLMSRPRLEIRNRTGSFRTVESETSKYSNVDES